MRLRSALLAALVLCPALALAQSSPNWPYGYRVPAAEWNQWWSSKQDVLPYTPLKVGNNLSDVANPATALTNLGGQSSANITATLASPPAIGGTTPAAGAFTTLSATGVLTASNGGGISGPLMGGGVPYASTDLNSLTRVYQTAWAASPGSTNGPPSMASTVGNGYVFNMGGGDVGGRGFQLLGGDGNNGNLWFRDLNNNVWKQVVTTVALASPPAIGGTTPAAGAFTTLSTTSGQSFGSQTGASVTDLSKHIALWGTTLGLNITTNRLNTVVPLGTSIVDVVNGADVLAVSSTGAAVTGNLSTTGYLTFSPNSTATPAGGGAGSLTWNFTGGGAEVDFWNDFTAPVTSFVWWQRTGTSAQTRLMDLDPTNGLTVKAGGATVTGAAGTNRSFTVSTGSTIRWQMIADGAAEAGSNAGSDFDILRYTDAGTYVDMPINISRATGRVTMSGGAAIPSGTINNTTIGATTPSTGAFTTLTATNPTFSASIGLGSTTGLSVQSANFFANNGNNSNLYVTDWRNSTGFGWATSSKRVGLTIDATPMGFIEFNAPGATQGLGLGVGAIGSSTYGLLMGSGGAVTLPITLTVTGATTLNGGQSFGTQVGTTTSDLSKHIALYGTNYGLNVTSNRLNTTVPVASSIVDVVNGADVLTVNSAGVTVAGHIVATGTAPTLGTCGTSPSIAAASSDHSGTITTGTGAPTSCAITFATAYATNPKCVVSAGSGTTPVAAFVGTRSTTAITINFAAGLTSGTVDYHCEG